MSRLAALLIVLMLPLVGASTPPPQEGSVWTVYTTVDVDVDDNYATVRIIADIGNRGPDPEFPFQVRVPADAFVTGFSIERDGDLWEGRIEDRDEARQEYDDQKSQENTAGLIEKKRGTQVYAFLVNVAEFESVQAILTYEMYLAAEQDVYNLALEAPVSGFGQDLGAHFDVRVCHTAGVDTIVAEAGSVGVDGGCRTASHSVGERATEAATPYNVTYAIPPTPDEGSVRAVISGGVGYFVHPFRAPADAQTLPLDLVLVLDTSGSMGDASKMPQMQDAAVQLLGMLDESDRIAIVEFNSQAFTELGGLEAADATRIDDARALVRSFVASGSTHMEAGLREGFGAYEGTTACDATPEAGAPCLEPRSRILVFLTDGQATVGATSHNELRALAKDENPGDVRLFSLAFGRGADYRLVAGLAKDNGGSALLVPQGAGAEVDLRRFMTALTTPVLENVVVTYDGDVDAYRASAPVLFQGSELLIVGTFDPALTSLSGSVTGIAADGPRSYDFDAPVLSGDSNIPRIVAYAQIQRLQGLIDAEGEQLAWKNELKELALAWGFVTDYTSLVISTELDDPARTFDPEAQRAESDWSAPSAFGGATATRTSTSGGLTGSATGTSGANGGAPGGGVVSDSDQQNAEPAQTPWISPAVFLAALAAMVLAVRRR